jgi:hypothetical protein
MLVMLGSDSDIYSPEVTALLAHKAGGGARPMALFPSRCADESVRSQLLQADATALFPGARDANAALSGLFLYFSCLKEAHELVDDASHADGMYWHAIMHRMEGDGGNSGYWFRHVGRHPLFPALATEAAELGYGKGGEWDPFAFVRYCEASAQSKDDELAKRVQLAEWQLLFRHCAGMAAR